jgi:hypothetical protein
VGRYRVLERVGEGAMGGHAIGDAGPRAAELEKNVSGWLAAHGTVK